MKKTLIKSLFLIAAVCAAVLNGCQKKHYQKTNDKPAPGKDGFITVCDTVPVTDTTRLKADDKAYQYYTLHKDWKYDKDYTICINITDPNAGIENIELIIAKKNHDIVTRMLLVQGWQQFTFHNKDGRFRPNLVFIFHQKSGQTDYPTAVQVDEGACKSGQTQKENVKAESSKNVTVLVTLDED